jgi:Dolichyl-phosphate-mannose-protein mannosyltransferase
VPPFVATTPEHEETEMKRPTALTKIALDENEPGPQDPYTEPLASFGAWGQRFSFITAIALIGFFLFSSLWIASRRPFWYDEINTVLVARLADCATIWRALAHAVDVLPASYFMLVRLFDRTFGPTELAARIPSALAMAAGLLIVFDCARRLSDNLHALAGVVLLTCSLLPYYGYEARPYALYFTLAAMELWLWLHTPESHKGSALLFGTTVFLAFNVHYYTALCLVPYAVFEAFRWNRWRAPSAKLIAGTLGILCGVAVLSQQILAARKVSPGFWAPPDFNALREVFGEFFPFGLFIAAVVLLWIAWTVRHETPITLYPMLGGERLGWFFLLIPVAGYVLAKLVTNAFFNRYFIGMLPGVAVAASCALWRRFRHSPGVSAGIVLIVLLFGLSRQISVAARPGLIEPPYPSHAAAELKELLSMESTLMRDGKKNIAAPADRIIGVEARYYSKKPETYTFVVTPSLGVTGRVHLNMAQYHPMRFWTLEDLRIHARETALVDPSGDVLNAMTEAGFRLRPIDAKHIKVIYLE